MRARATSPGSRLLHRAVVALGAALMTAVFFLVLPAIQAISKVPESDTVIQPVDAVTPPPPPLVEEEPEKPEEEPEEQPPELEDDATPLDLAQLELALSPGGFGGGWSAGAVAVKLGSGLQTGGDEREALFSLADLDQKPRIIYQPSPVLTPAVRSKTPGQVYILFVVDESGQVKNPVIQRSSDPAFERPALAAVKKWKFEPGKRSGKSVPFRMRVPITFPKG